MSSCGKFNGGSWIPIDVTDLANMSMALVNDTLISLVSKRFGIKDSYFWLSLATFALSWLTCPFKALFCFSKNLTRSSNFLYETTGTQFAAETVSADSFLVGTFLLIFSRDV